MTMATTGVALSLSSLGLVFAGLWFFRAVQKIGDCGRVTEQAFS